jgi:hypothetical protein
VADGITDEMIEAAAEQIYGGPHHRYKAEDGGGLVEYTVAWNEVTEKLGIEERVVYLRQARRILEAALAGRTVVDLPGDEQWFVFYGGPDPDSAAGCDLRDDETDAAEVLEWTDSGHGAGVARRSVHYGPWEITQFRPAREQASGVAGGGAQ